jgi:heterodisulfide reductase subunit C
MGRQQVEIMNGIGNNILEIGYCVHPDKLRPEKHLEQGPVWDWYIKNIKVVAPKFGANYHGEGAGALREISPETMEELRSIFKVTGGMEFHDAIANGKADD